MPCKFDFLAHKTYDKIEILFALIVFKSHDPKVGVNQTICLPWHWQPIMQIMQVTDYWCNGTAASQAIQQLQNSASYNL